MREGIEKLLDSKSKLETHKGLNAFLAEILDEAFEIDSKHKIGYQGVMYVYQDEQDGEIIIELQLNSPLEKDWCSEFSYNIWYNNEACDKWQDKPDEVDYIDNFIGITFNELNQIRRDLRIAELLLPGK